MTMKYGYARVSSKDQDLSIQLEALKAASCDMIRSEKLSARALDNREELKILLQFLREGDTLVVTRVDRLARSVRDLSNIVHDLNDRGISLIALQQQIDTGNPTGRAFLSMLGVFAEFENEIRRERQAAGIQRAKEQGKYIGKGRPPVVDPILIKQAVSRGEGATAIAKRLGISRATVYRTMAMELH
jgi:DNA invertase Pin-like site-specific DNA recombinase